MRHTLPPPAAALLAVASLSAAADASAHRFALTRLLTLDAGNPGVSEPDALVSDLSADGRVAVGVSTSVTGRRGFRWTESQGLVALAVLPGDELGWATAVSADGTTAVGYSGLAGYTGLRAVRWTGWSLDDVSPPAWSECLATAASADGEIVVGSCWNVTGPGRAFRWTAGAGTEILPLPATADGSQASDVSDDGMVVVGRVFATGGVPRAFVWDRGGAMIDLGTLPGGAGQGSWANAVSAGGSTVVGQSGSGHGTTGFRWRQATGVQEIGRFQPTDVSGSGDVVVGQGVDPTSSARRGYEWTEGLGLVDLGLPGCAVEIEAVSADARVVGGSVELPVWGWPEAALARVERGCGGLAGDVAPGVLDLTTDPPTWRPVGDGLVTVGDVVALLREAVGLQRTSCAE